MKDDLSHAALTPEQLAEQHRQHLKALVDYQWPDRPSIWRTMWRTIWPKRHPLLESPGDISSEEPK